MTNVGSTARILSILRSWLWSTTSFASGTIWQGFANAHMASSSFRIFLSCRKWPNDYTNVSIRTLDSVRQPRCEVTAQEEAHTFKASSVGLVKRLSTSRIKMLGFSMMLHDDCDVSYATSVDAAIVDRCPPRLKLETWLPVRPHCDLPFPATDQFWQTPN